MSIYLFSNNIGLDGLQVARSLEIVRLCTYVHVCTYGNSNHNLNAKPNPNPSRVSINH